MTIAGITQPDLYVKLPRYAELVHYPECAFFGVSNPDDSSGTCRDIWTKSQRDEIARALAEAQEAIEAELCYPLLARWIENERHAKFNPTVLTFGKVIALGTKVTTSLGTDVAVNTAGDPSTASIAGLSITDTDGIRIYHAGTTTEIIPSLLDLSAGTLTIEFPRCRSVKPEFDDNPATGWEYTDLTYFADKIDVVQETTDETDPATFVFPNQSSPGIYSCDCSEYTCSACSRILNSEIGSIESFPADYSGGTWVRKYYNMKCASAILVNYKAGLTNYSRVAENALVRYAHTMLPAEPCGCDVIHDMWRRDNDVPDYLSSERLNCPFGLSNGAWIAWAMIDSSKLVRMTTL